MTMIMRKRQRRWLMINWLGKRRHGQLVALDLFRLADHNRIIFRSQLGSRRTEWVRLDILPAALIRPSVGWRRESCQLVHFVSS